MAGRGVHNGSVILLVAFVPQCVVSMVSMTPPVMATQIAHDLNLPPHIAGVYVALVYVGAILSNAYAPSLITRFGALRTSFACMISGGAGLALLSASGLTASLLSTALIGLSYGPLTPASSHLLARYHNPGRMALLVSARQTSVPLGGVLAGVVAPSLILNVGWQAACVWIGCLAAVIGALTWSTLGSNRNSAFEPTPVRKAGLFEPVRFIVRHPGLSSLAAGSTVYAAMQLVLSSFLVVHLTTAANMNLIRAGALLSVSQLAGVAGRLGWGYAADRVASPRLLLLTVATLMAVAAVMMSLLTEEWPFNAITAVVVLLGATASGWNGVFLAEIIRAVRPADVGLATSGSMMFAYAGTVFGPWLFGKVAGDAGFPAAYLVMAAAVLVGGITGAFGGAWRPGAARV